MRAVHLILLVLMTSVAHHPTYLTDKTCATETLSVIVGDDARVYLSCRGAGADRTIHVAVVNMASAKDGSLREFGIGFCEPAVLDATGQPGWKVEIDSDRRTVTWSVPDDGLGVPSRARVSGFSIRVKSGWRRSGWASARWDDRTTANAVLDGC